MLGRNVFIEKRNRLLSEEAGGLKTYLSARWSFFGPEPDHQRSDDRKERFHSKSETAPKGIGGGLKNHLSARWSFFTPRTGLPKGRWSQGTVAFKTGIGSKGKGRELEKIPFGPIVVFPVLNQVTMVQK